jgi:hypothetical protein
LVDEANESLFKESSGCERIDGGSLSLDRDLRGGIGEGLWGHVAGMRGKLEVEHVKASGVIDVEA